MKQLRSNMNQENHVSQNNNENLSCDLQENLSWIFNEIGHNSDVKFREFLLGDTNIQLAIIFIDGLSNADLIQKHILGELMSGLTAVVTDQKNNGQSLNINEINSCIKERSLTVCTIEGVSTFKKLKSDILFGSIALLIDGISECFLIGEALTKSRDIKEPDSEALVRGPRLGFVENLADNTAMLRRSGKNPDLTMIGFEIGEVSKKELVIAYISSIADSKLIEEVKKRIKRIEIDSAPDSGYIEQLIEDNYLSPFPQIQSTERPDRVMSALMEGRVAIILDGSPFALIAPVTFQMLLQSPEDYYERWFAATLVRLLRYFSCFIALFAPSLYIAFISFHQGLIPTKLVFHIAATRGGVPFPPLIEALIMEISIEVLREAGLRLPKPIGQSLGIVGGLIIGQAAVEAGIVSTIMVIVVAVTAISSFTLPQYNVGIALRMLRFISMIFASIFGLYGVVLFFLLLCSHLVKLKSFGVPYLSPAAPIRFSDWKDFIVRAPSFMMKNRPKSLQSKRTRRMK
ncbi:MULTISPECIES: spore germination protein [unclassified Bacillus (in: firmicutes)]|uniref:spore germination protein n=1 Tax=unclassified Bacillus (in: firmicutes) TaxID=185979 RepID=UPI000BF07E03|nr:MULTISPECIES: spore germination protein [unclassified Bacillus (in: firmicutes)]PEJ56302.1 spore germination protein [Bacillus sp. AFS002410]PEL10487.1 spore germination protein [Bacillus sp. AFS017336]